MGLVTRGVRTFAVAVTASTALVVPFAADAHAPVAAQHHDHVSAPASRVVDPGTSAEASRALPRVRGHVGPGMTISVNRSRVVKGRYRVVVQDESTAHNWHISGPGGVDRKTSVTGTGKWVWKVRLRPGTYSIVCDTHPTTMKTSLRVTAD